MSRNSKNGKSGDGTESETEGVLFGCSWISSPCSEIRITSSLGILLRMFMLPIWGASGWL